MEALREPISPELILVTPELRSLAIRQLPAIGAASASAASEALSTMRTPSANAKASWPMPAQLALYAGWQALTGAVFGLAAFAVFLALLLLKPLISG